MNFEMNEQRDYLSVTIPVHKYFSKGVNTGSEQYEERIINILKKDTITITELALRMGYKGITAKLTRTVNTMVKNGVLKKTAVDNAVKLQYNGQHI